MSCVGGLLRFLIDTKQNENFVKNRQMFIHVQFGFNQACTIWEKRYWLIVPLAPMLKLFPVMATILDFQLTNKIQTLYRVMQETFLQWTSIKISTYIISINLGFFRLIWQQKYRTVIFNIYYIIQKNTSKSK
jgi:hypothetical protein